MWILYFSVVYLKVFNFSRKIWGQVPLIVYLTLADYNYEVHSVEAMEGAFNDAIDQLALEFSSSVSEYLMGDLQHGVVESVKTKVR